MREKCVIYSHQAQKTIPTAWSLTELSLPYRRLKKKREKESEWESKKRNETIAHSNLIRIMKFLNSCKDDEPKSYADMRIHNTLSTTIRRSVNKITKLACESIEEQSHWIMAKWKKQQTHENHNINNNYPKNDGRLWKQTK